MVRPFLVTHQGAHEVHFPRMEPILAAEGLTQGDPAAPVYAQLVYGGICQRVRDELDPKLLASFFDDTFIVDDFDLALKGVLKLKQLFHEVGLEVCLDKSSVYSTTPLTEEQLGELAEHGIRDAGEGILLLGTPIGSDSFIRQYLASETSSVMDILGDIQTAVDVGTSMTASRLTRGSTTSGGIAAINYYAIYFALWTQGSRAKRLDNWTRGLSVWPCISLRSINRN